MSADVWIWPRATVVDHHDGDTLYADVDLGRRTFWTRGSIRLARVDAPELDVIVEHHKQPNPDGVAALEFLVELVPLGTVVRLESVGYDKYGDRVDAEVILPEGTNVSDAMVEAGHAVYRDY